MGPFLLSVPSSLMHDLIESSDRGDEITRIFLNLTEPSFCFKCSLMIVPELGATYAKSIFVELETLLLFSVLFVEVPKRSCNVCATNVGVAVGIDSVR